MLQENARPAEYRPPYREENEGEALLAERKRDTNIGVGIGVLLQLAGNILRVQGGAFGAVGPVLLIVGCVLFIWGCMSYCEGGDAPSGSGCLAC